MTSSRPVWRVVACGSGAHDEAVAESLYVSVFQLCVSCRLLNLTTQKINMMLSASAARIGRVSSIITRKEVLEQQRFLSRRTSLLSSKRSSPLVPTIVSNHAAAIRDSPWGDFFSRKRSFSTSTLHEKEASRHVMTMTNCNDRPDDDHHNYLPRSTSKGSSDSKPVPKTQFEDWMINLGRGRNNEWLIGPRPKEWFTGLIPDLCPGMF